MPKRTHDLPDSQLVRPRTRHNAVTGPVKSFYSCSLYRGSSSCGESGQRLEPKLYGQGPRAEAEAARTPQRVSRPCHRL